MSRKLMLAFEHLSYGISRDQGMNSKSALPRWFDIWQHITMIELLGLSGKALFVNHELIRTLESGPETILCFVDGTRVPVRNQPQEIVKKIIEFKVKTNQLQTQELAPKKQS